MALELLEQLGEAVGALGPAVVPPGELGACLVVLERLSDRVEACKLELTGAWEQSGEWADDGALSPAAWLRLHLAVSSAAARQQVRTARALRAAPVLREAFRAGELSVGKVRLLAPLVSGERAELFARDEAVLVGEAKAGTVEAVGQLVRCWRAYADDELGRPDEVAERLDADQALFVSDTFEGAVVADLRLAPVEGAVWRGELDRLTEELWQASTGEERTGVSAPRRRALAQVEMARRSAEWRAETTGKVVPLFVGVIDLDVLEGRTGRMCETDRGGRMTSETVQDWLGAGANFAPLVTGPGGAVLHFGRSRRVASAKQRQAVAVRDRRCVFSGCDWPAGFGDVHHLVPWEHGGGTDIDNLVLLCHRHHHQVVHEGGFHPDPDRDEYGRLRWRRPDGTLIPVPYRDWHPATDPPLPFTGSSRTRNTADGVKTPGPDTDATSDGRAPIEPDGDAGTGATTAGFGPCEPDLGDRRGDGALGRCESGSGPVAGGFGLSEPDTGASDGRNVGVDGAPPAASSPAAEPDPPPGHADDRGP